MSWRVLYQCQTCILNAKLIWTTFKMAVYWSFEILSYKVDVKWNDWQTRLSDLKECSVVLFANISNWEILKILWVLYFWSHSSIANRNNWSQTLFWHTWKFLKWLLWLCFDFVCSNKRRVLTKNATESWWKKRDPKLEIEMEKLKNLKLLLVLLIFSATFHYGWKIMHSTRAFF